jgi:hypothetical protein
LAVVVLVIARAPNGTASGPLVGIAPNPVAFNERGEYLLLEFPDPTNLDGWTIADGEPVVSLPDRTVHGRIVLTNNPAFVEPWVDPPVLSYRGRLALANAGEVIEVRHYGRLVARVAFGRTPQGFRHVRSADDWVWQREGSTAFDVTRTGPASVRVFVLPDAPDETERVLAAAQD